MEFFKSLDSKLASINPNNFIKPEAKSNSSKSRLINNSIKSKFINNSVKSKTKNSRSNKNDELENLFKSSILENQEKKIGPNIGSSTKMIQEVVQNTIASFEFIFDKLNESIEKINEKSGNYNIKPLPKFEKADIEALLISIKAIEDLSNNQEDVQNISQGFAIFLVNFDKSSKMKMLLKLAGIDISYQYIINNYSFAREIYVKSIQNIIKHKEVFAVINQLQPKIELLLGNKHFVELLNFVFKMPPVQTQIQTYMPDKRITEIVLRFYLTTREIAQGNSDLTRDCDEVWQATRGFISIFCSLIEKFKESLPSSKIPDTCLKYTN